MDIRREEALAMIGAFLGDDYDPRKVHALLEMQRRLHEVQASLLQEYESHGLSAQGYVEHFNRALRSDLEGCQRLLGGDDFNRLFGCSIDEAQGYIELDAFLASEAERAHDRVREVDVVRHRVSQSR